MNLYEEIKNNLKENSTDFVLSSDDYYVFQQAIEGAEDIYDIESAIKDIPDGVAEEIIYNHYIQIETKDLDKIKEVVLAMADEEFADKLSDSIQEAHLEPKFDNAQSFYGKARVEDGKLYSYDTLVAEIKDGTPIVYNLQSMTTVRHVKEFLKQNGFPADSTKQMKADYMQKEEPVEEKHNGWTNYDTWKVVAYADNVEPIYNTIQEHKDEIAQMSDEGTKKFYMGLIAGKEDVNWDKVNWKEVRTRFQEDLEESTYPEQNTKEASFPEYDKEKDHLPQYSVDDTKLYSRDEVVAEIIDGEPVVYTLQSPTTVKIIREFLKQKGFSDIKPRQLSAMYRKPKKKDNYKGWANYTTWRLVHFANKDKQLRKLVSDNKEYLEQNNSNVTKEFFKKAIGTRRNFDWDVVDWVEVRQGLKSGKLEPVDYIESDNSHDDKTLNKLNLLKEKLEGKDLDTLNYLDEKYYFVYADKLPSYDIDDTEVLIDGINFDEMYLFHNYLINDDNDVTQEEELIERIKKIDKNYIDTKMSELDTFLKNKLEILESVDSEKPNKEIAYALLDDLEKSSIEWQKKLDEWYAELKATKGTVPIDDINTKHIPIVDEMSEKHTELAQKYYDYVHKFVDSKEVDTKVDYNKTPFTSREYLDTYLFNEVKENALMENTQGNKEIVEKVLKDFNTGKEDFYSLALRTENGNIVIYDDMENFSFSDGGSYIDGSEFGVEGYLDTTPSMDDVYGELQDKLSNALGKDVYLEEQSPYVYNLIFDTENGYEMLKEGLEEDKEEVHDKMQDEYNKIFGLKEASLENGDVYVKIETSRDSYEPSQVSSTLTVRELIDVLNNFDEDCNVYLSNDNGYSYGGITSDAIEDVTVNGLEENEDNNNNTNILDFKEEIIMYTNNTETKEYLNLTDEDIEKMAEETYMKVSMDDEFNRVLTDTIQHYVEEYLDNRGE